MNVNASVLPYREESLCFGPESRLIATLTLPGDHPDSALPAALTGSAELPPPHPHLHQASRTSAHPAAAGRAPQRRPPGLILLNAGMLPRIGPHRLNVELARTAAAQGVSAIRFDLPGLGDSGFTSSRLSHDEQTRAAIEDAMTLLSRTKHAPDRFLIAGLCSGADAGFQMARDDSRIVGLYMMEPYYFPNRFSNMFRTLRRLREYGMRRSVIRILQKSRFTRRHDPAADSAPVPQAAPEEGVRAAPTPQHFAEDLRSLLGRGVQIKLIYANTLMGHWDMRHHHRHIFSKVGHASHFDVELVPHTDHVFTRVEARRHLIRGMAAWLRRIETQQHASAA